MVSSVGGERKQSWHKYVCLINEEASWAFLIPIPVSRCRLLESRGPLHVSAPCSTLPSCTWQALRKYLLNEG